MLVHDVSAETDNGVLFRIQHHHPATRDAEFPLPDEGKISLLVEGIHTYLSFADCMTSHLREHVPPVPQRP